MVCPGRDRRAGGEGHERGTVCRRRRPQQRRQVCEGAIGREPVVADGGPEPTSPLLMNMKYRGASVRLSSAHAARVAARRSRAYALRPAEGREHRVDQAYRCAGGATPRLHDVGVLDDVFVQAPYHPQTTTNGAPPRTPPSPSPAGTSRLLWSRGRSWRRASRAMESCLSRVARRARARAIARSARSRYSLPPCSLGENAFS